MSTFINQMINMNECGTLINTDNTSYSDFMEKMLELKSELCEAVNLYNRIVNENAISILLEDGGNNEVAIYEKENLLQKIKKIWENIVEWFFKRWDSLVNWLYEQIVIQKKYIEKHKNDIMNTTIIYGKQPYDVLDSDGDYKSSGKIWMAQYEIQSYKNILNPDFVEPIVEFNELNKYMDNDNKLKTNDLLEYYKNNILGNEAKIKISSINSAKADLIKSIGDRYDEVKKRKAKIIAIRKRYQNPPKNVTPEEVAKFQNDSIAQIKSLELYNKVTVMYCKEVVKILKLFIKNTDKEDK